MTKPMWKTPAFWIALVLANLSLLASNGVFGGGQAEQIAGWVMTIATMLGYKKLTEPADPAV